MTSNLTDQFRFAELCKGGAARRGGLEEEATVVPMYEANVLYCITLSYRCLHYMSSFPLCRLIVCFRLLHNHTTHFKVS
jgi:hypothetical protein